MAKKDTVTGRFDKLMKGSVKAQGGKALTDSFDTMRKAYDNQFDLGAKAGEVGVRSGSGKRIRRKRK